MNPTTTQSLQGPRGPQYPQFQNANDGIGPLHIQLTQLIGELFLFARMSYGDELTLHFGDLRLSDSKKLKDRRYGTYILGFRGSPWILKSGSQPVILGSWFGVQHLEVDTHARAMTKADIENGSLVEVGGRVIAASPYVWKTTGAVGVHIVLSDGLVMDAIPTPPDAEDDDPSPPLASWEILGPHGLLKVGPGVKWEIIPTIKKTA